MLVAPSSATWAPEGLHCPQSGRPLRADSAHSLSDGVRRYPVVDGIPFLRVGRGALVERTLAALDAGEADDALALLLGDRDDWATAAPPSPDALRALIGNGAATFRAALEALAFGPTATYLAHRWSDPTFVAGLGLLATHAPRPGAHTFEIACGTGPYLRELLRCGMSAAGGDVVFSKLWLARRFVAPEARLVCFDAATAWPFVDGAFEFVHCHDAFYFLPRKDVVASEMRRLTNAAGTLAISHAHNAAVDNLSAGDPLRVAAYEALFPGAVLYDDRELADALLSIRPPQAKAARELDAAAAIALVVDSRRVRVSDAALALPPAGASLVRNPLYDANARAAARIRWPSERYQQEYAALATYASHTDAPAFATMGEHERVTAWARKRELVALPERW